jgi:hypothetical protein
MKTRDFDSFTRTVAPPAKRSKQVNSGMGFGIALLGLVCVAGVFAVLALLYNFS